MWWIIGGLIIGVVLVFVIWLMFFATNPVDRFREEGEHLLAWIVPVGIGDVGHSYFVMLIFSFDKSIEDVASFLENVATRMMELEDQEELTGNEKEVLRWLQEYTTFKMIGTREKLPKSMTEGKPVWCQKGYAKKTLLPDGELELPYIYIAAIRDDPAYIPMIPYPDDKE